MKVHVVDKISQLRVGDPLLSRDAELLANPHVIQGLTGRILRDCLYAMQVQTSVLQNDFDSSLMEMEERIAEVVPGAVQEWWSAQRDSGDFLAMRDGPSAQECLRRYGELAIDVQPYSECVDVEGLQRWHAFEKVRTAAYITLNRDTYPELEEKIEESYEAVRLKNSAIAKLKIGDGDSVDAFVEETSRGIFVFGFHENVDGKPSVAEQMKSDFMTDVEDGSMRYIGKCLLTDKKELLSWLTYWEMPHDPNEACKKTVHEYLMTGVTGGTMEYKGAPGRDKFMTDWRTIQMFDTICSSVSMAGSRLFAKALQEMWENNPQLRDFMAYRLYELFMEPRFDSLGDRNIRFGDNESSGLFFGVRKCQGRAFDFNPHGPKSRRDIDGTCVLLNPMWEMFSGEMQRVLLASWGVWRSYQEKYGDVTEDGINYGLVCPEKLQKYVKKRRI